MSVGWLGICLNICHSFLQAGSSIGIPVHNPPLVGEFWTSPKQVGTCCNFRPSKPSTIPHLMTKWAHRPIKWKLVGPTRLQAVYGEHSDTPWGHENEHLRTWGYFASGL